MELYRNGDICPCCGNMIDGKSDEWLELFSITVPPPGRLIDADALDKEINRICDEYDAAIISEMTYLNRLLDVFRNAPTIIPGRGGRDTKGEKMKLYRNGDICPCCGNMIDGKSDE